MTVNQMSTVAISVIEGRYFNKKPGSKVYLQCKFNTEILSTNPSDHVTSPIWDTELAWEVENKVLSYTRSQRENLKLIIYSIDNANRRDTIGYVMLDLRGASQSKPVPEKWHVLINSKQGGAFKPEIKLGFSIISNDVLNAPPVKVKKVKRPSYLGNKSSLNSKSQNSKIPPFKIPVHLTPDGYYQISNGETPWVFSFMISFAENLNLLQYNNVINSKTLANSGGFSFFFTFLGEEIVMEPFFNLSQPNFSVERVNIKLKATYGDLEVFIKELAKVTVYLRFSGDEIIGITEIPLSPLLGRQGEFNVIEKVYNLFDSKHELPLSHDSKSPSIGVSIKLTPMNVSNDASQPARTDVSSKPPPMPLQQTFADNNEQHSIDGSIKPTASLYNYSPQRSVQFTNNLPESPKSPTHINDPFTSLRSSSPSNHPHHWRQYRFSVDFRSVRDFRLKHANIFLKYTYIPFGTSAPIISHPPLEVFKSTHDLLLPPSFCAFEFVMSMDTLKTYLEGVPFVVEVWHKDNLSKDSLLGTANIDLSEVLKSKRIVDHEESGVSGSLKKIQHWENFVDVYSNGSVKKVAELRVSLALEDFGEVAEADEDTVEQLNRMKEQPTYGNFYNTSNNNDKESRRMTTPENITVSTKDALNHKAALELENWKQHEQEIFLTELKEKEASLVKNFEEKEKERAILLKKKSDDFKDLESQMQNLVSELENREKLVIQKELELQRRKDFLEREHQRAVDNDRDTARRLHEEYKHRITVEGKKTMEAEESRVKALDELESFIQKYKALEDEFSKFRRSLNTTPEANLKAELNKAKEENLELVKKLDVAEKTKKHYKIQWVNTLKQFSKLKKVLESKAQESLKKDKNEVDKLKLKFLAEESAKENIEEGKLISSLKKELEEIKNNSNSGIDKNGANESSSGNKKRKNYREVMNSMGLENFSPKDIAELERLGREKDMLLGTGMYSENDLITKELDRRIELILNS